MENIPGREDQEPVEPRQGKIDQPLYPQSDPLDVHPDERVVEAKAGSVIVIRTSISALWCWAAQMISS